ncbi:MAG: hypothetical protein P8K78_03370, partial [Pirellulales bacterium]|nr:hypothetical protein [Pirellulales bacterium]
MWARQGAEFQMYRLEVTRNQVISACNQCEVAIAAPVMAERYVQIGCLGGRTVTRAGKAR